MRLWNARFSGRRRDGLFNGCNATFGGFGPVFSHCSSRTARMWVPGNTGEIHSDSLRCARLFTTLYYKIVRALCTFINSPYVITCKWQMHPQHWRGGFDGFTESTLLSTPCLLNATSTESRSQSYHGHSTPRCKNCSSLLAAILVYIVSSN